MRQIIIPDFLSHLKRDERGYPVPFFVGYIDGKPDFRLMDHNKQALAAEKKLCGICGKKLFEYFYFITGPIGLENGSHSDPPMHRGCAEYSLSTCPHLLFENAQRNERGDIYKKAKEQNVSGILTKGKKIFLIKSDKYKYLSEHGLFKFRVIDSDKYIYTDGVLNKSNE